MIVSTLFLLQQNFLKEKLKLESKDSTFFLSHPVQRCWLWSADHVALNSGLTSWVVQLLSSTSCMFDVLLQPEWVCPSSPWAPLGIQSNCGQVCVEVCTQGVLPWALPCLQWCSGKSILFPTKRHKGQELPHKCSQEECLCGWGGAWGKVETALLKAQVFSSFRWTPSPQQLKPAIWGGEKKGEGEGYCVPLKCRAQIPGNFVNLFRGRSSVQCTWLIKPEFWNRDSVNL